MLSAWSPCLYIGSLLLLIAHSWWTFKDQGCLPGQAADIHLPAGSQLPLGLSCVSPSEIHLTIQQATPFPDNTYELMLLSYGQDCQGEERSHPWSHGKLGNIMGTL